MLLFFFQGHTTGFKAQVSNQQPHFHLRIYYRTWTVISAVRDTAYWYLCMCGYPNSLQETAWPCATIALQTQALQHRRTRWLYPMVTLDRLRRTKNSDGQDNQQPVLELGSPWTWKVSKGQFLYQRVPAGGGTTYPDSFLSSAHSVSNFGGTKARRRVRADAGGGRSSTSASSFPLWWRKSDSSSECLWNTVSWSPYTNVLQNATLDNI